MEYTDKVSWKRKIVNLVIIALLIFIIFNQIRIVKTIKDNASMLDADPLVYGARKYGIGECSCFVNGKELWFNQNNSKWIIKSKGLNQFNSSFNLSEAFMEAYYGAS